MLHDFNGSSMEPIPNSSDVAFSSAVNDNAHFYGRLFSWWGNSCKKNLDDDERKKKEKKNLG